MTDLFAALEHALDPTIRRPCLAADVELARFVGRWRGPHAVIHNPRADTYVRLSGDDAEVAASLDGTHSVADLTVAGLDGGLRPDRLAGLLASLHRGGFLTTPPVDTYAVLEERTHPSSGGFAERAWRRMRNLSVEFRGAHRFVDTLYNRGGRTVFSSAAVIGLLVLLGSGATVFLVESASGRFDLLGDLTVAGAATLIVLQLVAISVHELGHALAIRHAGRRILSAGVELYLGTPAFFIDSSDMVMAGRRQRAINALAGPFAGCVVAAAAALGGAAAGPSAVGETLFRLAGVTFVFNLINLVPFLELDGYWLLTDLIDEPDLRPRSLCFLRHELGHRIRFRQRLTRGEWGLVAFGVLGVVFTVLALALAWVFWSPVLSAFARGLWETGVLGQVLLVLLAALVLSPLLHALGPTASSIRRSIRAGIDAARFRAQRRWRVAAAEMIAALPHAANLSAEDLNDLAGRVHRRVVSAGAVMVREGDAADAFFLIRRGRCSVLERSMAGTETVVARLEAGSTFGELALLEGSPRSATVRADTAGEVFVIDAATFQRILAGPLAGDQRAPPDWLLTQVWRLTPFRNLDLHSVTELAAGGTWMRVAPGDEIVRVGDSGDAFYVVGSGQLEVTRGGYVLGSLAAGDFFGETALLHEVARTATVMAVTPARVFAVPRLVFDRVLRNAFDEGELVAHAATGVPARR